MRSLSAARRGALAGLAAALVLLATSAVAVGQEIDQSAPSVPSAAPLAYFGQWSMTVDGRAVHASAGSSDLALYGHWWRVTGKVGDALSFGTAPTYGVVDGTDGVAPGALDFALGASFATSSIPKAYSGNLVQKGLWGDSGQVKLQVVPAGGGTVDCRIKGDVATRMLTSTVRVGDGGWHSALCWRTGTQVGLTVDGITRSVALSVGAVDSERALHLGNKGDGAKASDQFNGAIDCAVYAVGDGAQDAATSAIAC